MVGKAMILEQALEFFGMESTDQEPTKNVPEEEDSLQKMKAMLRPFITYYGYLKFSISAETETSVNTLPVDEFFNYANNLCQWAMVLDNMNDTAKEADLERMVLNCKQLVPFFYSHSHLSKYLRENVDLLIKTEYLLSPVQRLRTLEYSYVNTNGKKGQSKESDLAIENSVKNRKVLIKSLGANKTEQGITRVTDAADAISWVVDKVDTSLNIQRKSGWHSRPTTEDDVAKVKSILRDIRPFKFTEGRKCRGFSKIKKSPLDKIDRVKMRKHIDNIVQRHVATNGAYDVAATESDDEWVALESSEFGLWRCEYGVGI